MDPPELPLSIDGKTDPCSKNVDLNFEFIGFGITGEFTMRLESDVKRLI